MSLLTILQDASDIVGLPQISQVVGNSEPDVRQLRALMLKGAEQLLTTTNSTGGGWSVLDREHEFDTVEDQAEYALPQDFSKITVDTVWKADEFRKLRGSISAQTWAQIRARKASSPYRVFRIFRTGVNNVGAISQGGAPNIVRKFTLEPAPGGVESLVYEYVSQSLWISADGTQIKRVPNADDDESLLGNSLHVGDTIWRFKSQTGLAFSTDLADFEILRDKMLVQDEAAEAIQIGWSRRSFGNRQESDVEWCA